MNNKKLSFFITESISFISYLLVGAFSCTLAFFIVIQFLNPALSENQNEDQILLSKDNSKSFLKNIKDGVVGIMKNKSGTESKQPKKIPEAAKPNSGAVPSGELPPEAAKPNLGAVPPDGSSSTEAQSPVLEVEVFMSPFIYDPERRRDPFEDPTAISQTAENIVFVPKTPPERYDLNQLKLKGIIWDIKSPKALFQLPGGGGFYTLLRGDKIGKNGIIFEIREDEVVIIETIFKVYGADKVKETDIKIIKLDRLKL